MALSSVANIALSGSDSQGVPLGNQTLVGIFVPTLANSAAISLRNSPDGTNFYGVFDDAGEVTLAASGGGVYWAINPADALGLKWIKVRTGTNASAVSQASALAFTLDIREKR